MIIRQFIKSCKKCRLGFVMFMTLISLSISSFAQVNNIEVRMLGASGSESVSLQVGGTTVMSWTPTTALASYTASTSLTGEVRVAFTNDATGRDVRVDYIVVNGSIRQAEDQPTNTGSYSGTCGGGSYSEWLYCSGYISFGSVGSVVTSSRSSVASSITASSASSSACVSTAQKCNWYGTSYPLCVTTQSGWGWENQQSCISRTTCSGQPAPYGITGGSGSCPVSSVSSSSVIASSTPSSVSQTSSSRSSSSAPSSSSSSSTSASDPLMPTGKENSGSGCYVPELPSYASLPTNAALPNPFKFINGTTIATKYDWACRRAEVNKQAQVYELGEKPDRATANVNASATNTNIAVTVQDAGKTISFNASIQLPTTGTAPYPAMITMGGSSLNNTALLNRGVAIINFPNNDIAEQTDGSSRGKGKFYTLYGTGHGAGAMSAWAWGVSRLIDALEKTPAAKIDASHLGMTGCSRNGKGALIAGATDERIMLTIPQESGSGGSALWRVSDAQRSAGQNVQTLSEITGENVWFRSSFSQFNNTANKLPFDHHQILGMVAPRALLVIENTSMEWLGNVSTYTGAIAAREIWLALGIGDRMGVSQVGNHNHCAFPASQQPEVDAFVDKFLKGTGNGNTNVVKTDGSFNVDRARWINWTTPNLQ